jgi:hypothetical protein
LLSLQNSDASQSETEEVSPSQYDAENEVRTISVGTHGDSSIGNICNSNLGSETVGSSHEASGVVGGPDSLQVMIDDNRKNRNVDAPQVEIYAAHDSQISCGVQNGVCDSNMRNEVGDPHAAVGVGESNVVNDSHAEMQLSDSNVRSGVGDFHTESVIGSCAECIVGNSHAEIGVDNAHTENGTSDSQAEVGVHDSQPEVGVDYFHADDGADDSHSEVGVDYFHADDGTDDSHSEIGVNNLHTENRTSDSQAEMVVSDSHAEVAFGDSNPESGIHNSHARNGAGECHSWVVIGDPCSEYGINEDLRSVCGSVGLCSEVKVLDVSQSSGRESTEPDLIEKKKTSQVPKRQKLISNSSGSKRRIFSRSCSPVMTRSKSRCRLRHKKLSSDFEYPLQSRQSRSRSRSEGRKVSRSTFSRHKSYKDVCIQNGAMKKTVAKNDRKVFPNSRCPCDRSVAVSDRVRRRFRSGDSFRRTPQKPKCRSISCSETVEKPFSFTDEFKDNMLTEILLQTTLKCNTETTDKPANINKVTLISNSNNEVVDNLTNVINMSTAFSNSSNTSTENYSSGNLQKRTCCNDMSTVMDKILRNEVLDHRPSSELCIDDIVKMKAKALPARKFRPMSQVEDLQRKMMRELQSI